MTHSNNINRHLGIVSSTFFYATESARAKGYDFVASGNSVTIYDVQLDTQILIQGGQIRFYGANAKNSGDFSVIDKDNILGYHTLLGLPNGYPLELKRYVEDDPYPPITFFQSDIEFPTVAPVVSGLYLRAVYTNNGSNDVDVGIRYKWFEVEDL